MRILRSIILFTICFSQTKEITIVFGNENSKLVRFELELAKGTD